MSKTMSSRPVSLSALDAVPLRSGAAPSEKSRSSRRAFYLLAPAGVLVFILAVCSGVVLRISFGEKNAEWSAWTLGNYAALFDLGYARIFVKTIGLALASAVLTVICAFPVAFYMARTVSPFMRRLVLICVMLPMLVSLLVQSYGWIAILGPDGLVNRIVGSLLQSERPTSLLFNDFGVLLGLVQTSLPLAVLPMASALATVSPVLEEAASVLGAPRVVVYRKIILPIAWPGIITGALLVFAFNAGAFAVPLLIGGLKVTTVALVIRDHMGALLDWPFGSALSVGLVAVVMGILSLRRFAVPPSGRR